MKYYLDTNIFLRFLVADNERAHQSCRTLFRLIEERKIKAVTSGLVFAEIVWVLGSFYKVAKPKISEILILLEKSGILCDNRFDISVAIALYAAQSVKFVDTLIASHPLLRQGKMTIISYDTDFDHLGVKRAEPDAIVRKVIRS